MTEEKIKILTKNIENMALRRNLCIKLLHQVEFANHQNLIEEAKALGTSLHTVFESLDYNTLNKVEIQLLDDMDKLNEDDNMLKVYDKLDLQIGTYLKKKFAKTKQCNRNLVM